MNRISIQFPELNTGWLLTGEGEMLRSTITQVSNSYIQNISESIGADVMNRISIQFPELNTGWLLTGEGEMLRSTITQKVGDIHGDAQGVNVNGSVTITGASVDKFLEEIAAQRRMTERYMDQMDRLITVYEKLMEGRK